MFLTKKHLSRRTVLRGAGVAFSLPLLDAMIPAGTALAATPANVKPRLAYVYFPHGAVQKFWTPEGTGKDFKFSRILKPLEDAQMRDYVTVVSGMRNKPAESSDPHGIVEATWLTCQAPTGPRNGADAGVSIDQIVARQIGKDTPLMSIELCGEPGGSVSYKTPNAGLPLEGNPRKVFTTMFGPGDSNAQRKNLLESTGSLLDYVRESTQTMNAELGASDRALMSDFLDSVREVEGRVQKMEAKADALGKLPNAPLGAPDDFSELVDIQFEMMALAFQTNQTRIATMRMIKEASMRTFPSVGVDEAFHPLSHHAEDPDKQDRLSKIQVYQTERFARFAKRMASIKEGDGNLLDNSIILFGSNMANSNLHNQNPLPQMILGKGGGIKGGQHLAQAKDTPHANLLLTMAQRGGVNIEKFAGFHRNGFGHLIMRNGVTFVLAAALVCSAAGAHAAGTKPAGTTPDGATPLMQAVFANDVPEAKRLLAGHANVNAVNAYGVNAMLLAAEDSNTQVIELLLKAGAKANSANLDGETALHLVARSGNVDAAKLLLAHGAKVDPREKFGDQTPLMWAAARRHAPMVELLASKGADVNARSAVRDYQRVATAESRAKFLDRGGFTPLLYAVRENCKDCVEVLLKHKVDINLPDPANVPPLSIAMMNGNWDIAKRLVEAGADVNAWDIFGQSPLHVAIEGLTRRGDNNPLDSDDQNKANGRELVNMLVERGANPNQQLVYKAPGRDTGVGRGLTPFLAACASGDIEIIKLLLAHGADIKLATADGQGAIILAVGSRVGGTANPGAASASGADFGNAQGVTSIRAATGPEDRAVTLIKFLAANGADVNLIAKRHFLQRTRGGSALHYAVRGNNKVLIGVLVDLGADINAKDEDGLTPLDYAMGRGFVPFLQLAKAPNKDLADTLRARGANVELAKTPDWPPQGAPIGTAVYDAVLWPVDPVGG